MNLNRILCPVSLSPASREPLRYAAALATAYRAQLFICHWAGERSDTSNEAEAVRKDIKRLLEDSVNLDAGSSEKDQLDWEPLVAEGRNPGEAVAAEAARQEIDLIVMSSKRRPLRATILGSTAEQVCHTAPCSVLVAHPDNRDWVASTGHIKLRRVLVAYDFSECAELALRQALSLASRHGAEVHLLHVLTEQGPDSPELRWERHEWIRLNAEKRLRLDDAPLASNASVMLTPNGLLTGAGRQRHTIHQSFVPAEFRRDRLAEADLSPRAQRDRSRRRDHDRLPVRTGFGRDALQLPHALLSGNDEHRGNNRGLCGAGEREARPSTSILNAPLGRLL